MIEAVVKGVIEDVLKSLITIAVLGFGLGLMLWFVLGIYK